MAKFSGKGDVDAGEVGAALDQIRTGRDMTPEQAYDDIIERIMSAGTVDEVLAGQDVTHARDILNVPLTVSEVHFNESTVENADGPGVYAVLQAKNDDGEPVVTTCGGRVVLHQLLRIMQLNGLPCRLQVRQSPKPTAAGYYPLWLRSA